MNINSVAWLLANGKHSAVFKNDNGVNEVLISKLIGVLK